MTNVQLLKPNPLVIDDLYGDPPSPSPISIRCPHCKVVGSFFARPGGLFYKKRIVNQNNVHLECLATLRLCPNQECKGIVLTVVTANRLLFVAPAEPIDFSTEHLPANITATLKEAADCYTAGAYRAAAMMVRRLLEEICEDNKAEGDNLHARLKALRNRVTLPDHFFDIMQELKLIGNDAAHVVAKDYDSIGREEATDAIDLVKEVLKALYQLKALLTRVQSRKKPA